MKVRATYEDGVLKPQTPLPLPEHAEVEVEVEATEAPAGSARLPFKTVPRESWEKAIGCVAIGGDALEDSIQYDRNP